MWNNNGIRSHMLHEEPTKKREQICGSFFKQGFINNSFFRPVVVSIIYFMHMICIVTKRVHFFCLCIAYTEAVWYIMPVIQERNNFFANVYFHPPLRLRINECQHDKRLTEMKNKSEKEGE